MTHRKFTGDSVIIKFLDTTYCDSDEYSLIYAMDNTIKQNTCNMYTMIILIHHLNFSNLEDDLYSP